MCFVLIGAVVGGSIAIYNDKMNRYEKIASPVGFSQFTHKQRDYVNDADFYVSINGNDKNDGSLKSPFRTIAKAKEEVRKLISSNKNGGKEIKVAVMAGEYKESNIVFDEKDSGNEKAPVTYTAYGDGEVIINGGMTLNSDDFQDVSGQALERLNKDVADKVKMLDLSKYNLTVKDYGNIKATGGFNTDNFYQGVEEYPECEFFFNDERMVLSRYPNDRYLKEGKVIQNGDVEADWEKEDCQYRGGEFVMDDSTYERVKNWKTLEDVWVFGYFYWDWADMSTPIAKINDEKKSLSTEYCSKYGFKEDGIYYFYNVLEELDAPGEYYIDRDNDILYFYPPENMESSQMMLSITTDNIFNITESAKYINIDGFTIQGTRGNLISLYGEKCSVKNCIIKNAAGAGVDINGYSNLLQSCEVTSMGQDAVILKGGVRETNKYGNNVVDNNSLHDYGKVQKTYIAGVDVDGIGNKVSHNEIYNAPHMGIVFMGNDNIIEYNNIHDVVLQSSDAGAIYTGFNYSTYGNVVRYNCISNIGSGEFTPNAIYFDDNSSGQTAYGNVIINIPGYAFLIGGGRDNNVTDNLIINAQKGIDYDDRAYDGYHNGGWYVKNVSEPDGRLWLLMKEAKELNQKNGHKYPGIDRMHQDYNRVEDEGFAVNPSGSTVSGNVVIKKDGKIGDIADSVYKYSKVENNFTYKLKDADGFFTDMKNGDYSLSGNSQLVEDNPKLKDIHFDKIGRY